MLSFIFGDYFGGGGGFCKVSEKSQNSKSFISSSKTVQDKTINIYCTKTPTLNALSTK